jgi:branched-chain amino acid transport system permease protein
MENLVQQIINGLTLGSIYGLIAIGYTMVFGIIGMVNFAHGDVFMVSTFIGVILFLALTQLLGVSSIYLALFLVLLGAMVLTSLWSWAIERVAYRPLRGSFRLAPLISAIGMSIFLMNFVQVAQGPRNKPLPPMFNEVIHITGLPGAPGITLAWKQILIMGVTAVLLTVFWWVVQKTSLGRAQRAVEQDRRMASLLGVDVDRTVSITFVIGAALAAVAGTLFHRGGAWRHRLHSRRRARRPAHRPHRGAVGRLCFERLQERRRFLGAHRRADLHAVRPAGPARSGEGLT